MVGWSTIVCWGFMWRSRAVRGGVTQLVGWSVMHFIFPNSILWKFSQLKFHYFHEFSLFSCYILFFIQVILFFLFFLHANYLSWATVVSRHSTLK